MANRNQAIGRYDEFAPVRLTIDQIVELSVKKAPRTGKPAQTIAELGGATLVRYHLGSAAIDEAGASMNVRASDYVDAPDITSVFGVVDKETGKAGAIMVVFDQRGPEICHVFAPGEPSLPAETMRGALSHLDVPPSRHAGADLQLARHFDCWFEDGEWVAKEPRHLIVQSYERICFAAHPVIRETIDVTMLEDESYPFDGAGDADAAYWNKDFYRAAGFDRMREMGIPGRRGFSSWLPKDLQRVKVIGASLDAEIEALEAARVSSPAP